MMGQAEILDCTLRDGAYIVDKKFGEPVIRGIIEGLVKANIDCIEIGFLQNEGYGEGKTVYRNAEDASKYVPMQKRNCKFAVLADFSRYSVENLEAYTGTSFDIVRECFFKKERYEALAVCKKIKEKGYKVFVQPVDILGYTDAELLELLELVNQLEPEGMSIVDTFGSMYEEDLQHIYSLIDRNLISTCKIGFHSHNNMQLSNALSQAFLRMAHGTRKVVIDSTISGMGRGAGNTPTELIAQYMVSKMGYRYNMDAILDVIDGYMDHIRSKCTWGYSTPYFICGCYSAHVNNVTYLTQKNSIRSKDIRFILNKIGSEPRKRYDYDLLEQTYVEYLNSEVDDSCTMEALQREMTGRNIVVIAPGNTATQYCRELQDYIKKKKAITICVNFVHEKISCDYVYVSNVKRYNYWNNTEIFKRKKKILTSNVVTDKDEDASAKIVSFTRLIKCGWEHLDNSTVMLLRLLDEIAVASIGVAGFDGYSYNENGKLNYASEELELANVKENPSKLNQEIIELLIDYMETRKQIGIIRFITPSRFSEIVEGKE